jgi:hypothetical protein
MIHSATMPHLNRVSFYRNKTRRRSEHNRVLRRLATYRWGSSFYEAAAVSTRELTAAVAQMDPKIQPRLPTAHSHRLISVQTKLCAVVFVVVAQTAMPSAAADPAQFPDLSGYTEVNANDYTTYSAYATTGVQFVTTTKSRSDTGVWTHPRPRLRMRIWLRWSSTRRWMPMGGITKPSARMHTNFSHPTAKSPLPLDRTKPAQLTRP